MTSPERWEVTQLIKSGVLDVTEYPGFDDEDGQVGNLSLHLRESVWQAFVQIMPQANHCAMLG